MSNLNIQAVRKSYGAAQILHGVSVDIEDGEFVVLVGPSGCGKSTLLRMIAGLESISDGTISIEGRVVNDLEPKDRDIAMVFQNYALYPQMTVAQNMGFSLELAGLGKAEIRRKVDEAASILSLEPLLDRKPSQLSGGQRQRVAMGRAIVRDPKVFLFDEPLSNLDAKLRVQMRSEIKALHQRLEATIVYVTHDQIEAMTMADKIVVMHGGRVEQVGAPLELYDRPANMFVAGFLGSPAMNFVKGSVRAADGKVLLLPSGTRIPVQRIPADHEGLVVFGIRPENVTLAAGDGSGVAASVLLIEPTGADTHMVVDVEGTTMTCVLKDRVNYAPGETLHLSFVASQSHFFDPASEQRIPVRDAGSTAAGLGRRASEALAPAV